MIMRKNVPGAERAIRFILGLALGAAGFSSSGRDCFHTPLPHVASSSRPPVLLAGARCAPLSAGSLSIEACMHPGRESRLRKERSTPPGRSQRTRRRLWRPPRLCLLAMISPMRRWRYAIAESLPSVPLNPPSIALRFRARAPRVLGAASITREAQASP